MESKNGQNDRALFDMLGDITLAPKHEEGSMTIEDFISSLMVLGNKHDAKVEMGRLLLWLEQRPKLLQSLFQEFGPDTPLILATIGATWLDVYRQGLPSDLEDVIPDEYKR